MFNPQPVGAALSAEARGVFGFYFFVCFCVKYGCLHITTEVVLSVIICGMGNSQKAVGSVCICICVYMFVGGLLCLSTN